MYTVLLSSIFSSFYLIVNIYRIYTLFLTRDGFLNHMAGLSILK